MPLESWDLQQLVGGIVRTPEPTSLAIQPLLLLFVLCLEVLELVVNVVLHLHVLANSPGYIVLLCQGLLVRELASGDLEKALPILPVEGRLCILIQSRFY